jgi:hypothetical protein
VVPEVQAQREGLGSQPGLSRIIALTEEPSALRRPHAGNQAESLFPDGLLDLRQAWDLYCNAFRLINKQLSQTTDLELQVNSASNTFLRIVARLTPNCVRLVRLADPAVGARSRPGHSWHLSPRRAAARHPERE